jgi:ABC-type nitrate/sulfonate/bicarbonate transport system substrate-binding protein
MISNGRSRSAWLRSAAATTLLVPAALHVGPASAQATPFRIGTGGNEANGDVFYAADMGYFERAGLTVDVQLMQNGAAVGAAIAGGSLDVGASSPFVFMNARRHGLPYTLIAPGALYQSVDATTVMAVPTGSPIRNAHDLNGKIVGGITVGALDQLAIWAWIDQNGGDSTTVKVIEISPSAMVDALEQNRIAAALVPEPQLSNAGSRIRSIGKAYDAISKSFMISAWFTTNEFAAKNPAGVRRFFEAMTQASAWAADNRERAAVILEKWTKVKVPKIRSTSARRLDPALIQPICDVAFKYKMIETPMDARQFIWTGRA